MLRKIISIIVATVVALNIICASAAAVTAADETLSTLVSLIKKFPHGKYWNHMGSSKNNPEKVTSTPCRTHDSCSYFGDCYCNSYGNAIQCMGYANLISEKITGVPVTEYGKYMYFDLDSLRVGDIVREGGHSVCITGIDGNRISITDCNYGARCIIRWTTVDASWFSRVQYVLHLEGNNRKNRNVNFHDKYKNKKVAIALEDSEPVEDVQGAEIWRMEDGSELNIRKSPRTSARIKGTVPAGARFKVYEKTVSQGYLWGRVEYDNMEGYCALNYADHISGVYEAPELKELDKAYTENLDFTVDWDAVSGADRYALYIYDSSKKKIATYKSKDCSADVEGLPLGTYYIVVGATSTKALSWKTHGEVRKLEVSVKEIKLRKISLRKSAELVAGEKLTLKAVLTPENTTSRNLVWTSSDKNVAKVNSKGRVVAVGAGKAEIICKSKQDGKIRASCTVSVKPSQVKAWQTGNGTTLSSTGLGWSESKGADGYVIYIYNPKSDRYTKIAETENNYYTDTELKASTEYSYRIKPFAQTDTGRVYAKYKTLTAKTAPRRVQGLYQLGSDTGRLKLTWKSQNAADCYVVYSVADNGKYKKLAVTKENSYLVKAEPFTEGLYCVVAAVKTHDGYVLGKASEEAVGITGIKSPTVTAERKDNAVKLSWTSIEPATGYQVYKLADGKKVLIRSLSSDKLSYTDKIAEKDLSYTYYIRAVHKSDEGIRAYSDFVKVKVR